MKRHLMTLILSGFVGSLVLAGNAEACHKQKCHGGAYTCAVAAAPCPAPAPVCQPTCAPARKCGMFCGFKGMKLGCHKRAYAPCATVAYTAPMTYSYSAPATYSSPQASVQH